MLSSPCVQWNILICKEACSVKPYTINQGHPVWLHNSLKCFLTFPQDKILNLCLESPVFIAAPLLWRCPSYSETICLLDPLLTPHSWRHSFRISACRGSTSVLKKDTRLLKMVKPPWSCSILYPSLIKFGIFSIWLEKNKHELLHKGLYEKRLLPSLPTLQFLCLALFHGLHYWLSAITSFHESTTGYKYFH